MFSAMIAGPPVHARRVFRPEYLLTACDYRLSNRGSRNSYRERADLEPADSTPAGFSCETLAVAGHRVIAAVDVDGRVGS
jgi:hypothetical protein